MKSTQELIDEIQNIKWLIDEGPAHVKLTEAQVRLTALKDALSAIEADAVNRVIKCQELLAKYIVPDSGISDHAVINDLIGVLDAPLVVGSKAHDDAVRRDCAEKINAGLHRIPASISGMEFGLMEVSYDQNGNLSYGPRWLSDKQTGEIIAVILGTEPAQEESE